MTADRQGASLPLHRVRHCQTCDCSDEAVAQPATSSEWARRQALEAAEAAVRAAREKRTGGR